MQKQNIKETDRTSHTLSIPIPRNEILTSLYYLAIVDRRQITTIDSYQLQVEVCRRPTWIDIARDIMDPTSEIMSPITPGEIVVNWFSAY